MRYEHLQHVSKRRELTASIQETKSKFNSESEEAKKYKDFVSRTQILKAYSFMDEDQTLLLKGKVGRVFSNTDLILATELLFSGFLQKLTVEQTCALFSILKNEVNAGKEAKDFDERISDDFWDACKFVEKQVEKLIEQEKKFEIEGDTEVAKRINLKMYIIVYQWA